MTDRQPAFPHSEAKAGIYVHVPFCKGRCPYCAFTTTVYDPLAVPQYVRDIIRELELWKSSASHYGLEAPVRADTIYFGGGTPSLLGPGPISRIIEACTNCFAMEDPCEITLEMNPATLSLVDMKDLLRIGVNRVSLGVQSLNDTELRFMGRGHDSRDAVLAFHHLRDAGFRNVSVDLIAGYPGQSSDSVSESTDKILALKPDHLSVYLLEVKEHSELYRSIRDGKVPAADDDLAADMYEDVCRSADSAGYEQYEISNFCLPGRSCRHNLKYWTDAPYLGIGPGSHGMTGRYRYANYSDLGRYGGALQSSRLPLECTSELTPVSRFKDALIMGLRLTRGLDLGSLAGRYRIDAYGFAVRTIGDLEAAGLFRLTRDKLTLTPRGRLLSNAVFSRWV